MGADTIDNVKSIFMKTSRGIIFRKRNISERKFRKLKKVTLYSISTINLLHLLDNEKIIVGSRHDTPDKIVRCIRLEYSLQHPIERHSEYVGFTTFHININFTTAPHYYGYTSRASPFAFVYLN
jgi:hypothetical protein